MKKLIFLMTITLLSCHKEEVTPQRVVSLYVDGTEIPDFRVSNGTDGNAYSFRGYNPDESVTFEMKIDEFVTQVFQPSGFQGDLKPVHARLNKVWYYLVDSSNFSLTVKENNGYHSGTFSGTLQDYQNNQTELNGYFINL